MSSLIDYAVWIFAIKCLAKVLRSSSPYWIIITQFLYLMDAMYLCVKQLNR